MDLDSILKTIANFSLKETLTYLGSKGIFSVAKEGFSSIRKAIQEKVNSEKFGFTPDKEESNRLIKISQKEYYKEFERLLKKHPHSDLIRVGYLVSSLNKIGGNKNRVRVKEIRDSVYNRPNGAKSIRIVELVTTEAIVPVIDYLSELKKRNYDTPYITEAFNEIVNNWNSYTIFVKAEHDTEKIVEQIKFKIKSKQKLIMIFASGSAINSATKAVAEILKEKDDYFYESKNNLEGDIEVHVSTFTLII